MTTSPTPSTAPREPHDAARPVPATGEFPPVPDRDAAGTATVNGSPVQVHEGFTLTDAVAGLTGREIGPDGTAADGHPLGIAVAVDDTVVPRSLWATTAVAAGQSVEIVTAVQGG
ncbi:sulfur carrier protein ThiS [Kocuria sp.]|uniref:sulfur carrier protein ThiS n=1 Tax=Kocuria sp. TaxID=1871328 RepID=UPI0026DAB8B0|nr:sulfur carrier protein ThiS [Kocuria sp.]MDO4918272.1 sulfur carrier protein ThiS [Kocuria sp.]